MRSKNSKKFHEKHTGVNRVTEKAKNLMTDEKGALGIVSLVIGVVMLMMINAYIPSMMAPVDVASAEAVNASGDADWIALQESVSDQNVATTKSIGIIPQILGVVAVLVVLTMLG